MVFGSCVGLGGNEATKRLESVRDSRERNSGCVVSKSGVLGGCWEAVWGVGLASDGLDLGAGLVVVCWEGVRSCIICLQSLVEAVEVEAWCWCLGWDYCPVGLVAREMEISALCL